LFFSIDPAANWLVASSLESSGYISQVFSQGYQFSAPSIAANSTSFNASSELLSLLRRKGYSLEDNIVPSGFYYASEMMYDPHTVKCVLDESAANTFANAKHNSVGKSNLAKVVHIYYPYTNEARIGVDSGGGTDDSNPGLGLASVNNFDLEKYN
jgi:hypothetical protein